MCDPPELPPPPPGSSVPRRPSRLGVLEVPRARWLHRVPDAAYPYTVDAPTSTHSSGHCRDGQRRTARLRRRWNRRRASADHLQRSVVRHIAAFEHPAYPARPAAIVRATDGRPEDPPVHITRRRRGWPAMRCREGVRRRPSRVSASGLRRCTEFSSSRMRGSFKTMYSPRRLRLRERARSSHVDTERSAAQEAVLCESCEWLIAELIQRSPT